MLENIFTVAYQQEVPLVLFAFWFTHYLQQLYRSLKEIHRRWLTVVKRIHSLLALHKAKTSAKWVAALFWRGCGSPVPKHFLFNSMVMLSDQAIERTNQHQTPQASFRGVTSSSQNSGETSEYGHAPVIQESIQ